jgi:hypothetical protein
MPDMQHEQNNPRPNTTPPLDESSEAAADSQLRRILAQYHEPTPLEAPADLKARVLASLPAMPPAAAAAAVRRRRLWVWAGQVAVLACMLALLWLGTWGIFIDSAGPARLFGDTAAGMGYLVLILVLVAKPFIHTLLTPGAAPLLVSVLSVPVLAALWWYLVRQTPASYALEPGG